ncbi:hypothetical protein L249_3137 [Ophiocordyceps polyrhachis-furcata BCC 54312]|uniref:Uncharacterized protein n=1 Tax=Ophiocordyceps polyrhachis-furcata BCC 54312 TaxID=1330021 RepID=A0A367LSB7_9HYPO|nr:hypothetical protein L249_3137 [Ophiocordyceps polyrhachis-furcata BCC 54312]
MQNYTWLEKEKGNLPEELLIQCEGYELCLPLAWLPRRHQQVLVVPNYGNLYSSIQKSFNDLFCLQVV